MILSHIVAVAKNGVIGVNNSLPWDIPEDLRFFREKTKGKALIMGRKTFESVGHPLPKRLNVVVTRQRDFFADGSVVVASLSEGIAYCRGQQEQFGDEVFIIGGGEIFKESMALVDKIYLTRIHQNFSGSVFYPDVDESQFSLIEQQDRFEPVQFSFLTYVRRQSPN